VKKDPAKSSVQTDEDKAAAVRSYLKKATLIMSLILASAFTINFVYAGVNEGKNEAIF